MSEVSADGSAAAPVASADAASPAAGVQDSANSDTRNNDDQQPTASDSGSVAAVAAETPTASTSATAQSSAAPSAVTTDTSAVSPSHDVNGSVNSPTAAAHSPADSSTNGGTTTATDDGAGEPAAKRQRKRKSLWDQTAPADGSATTTAALTATSQPTPPSISAPPNPLLAALQAQLALLPHLSSAVPGHGHGHLAASHALSSPTTASRLDRRIYVGSLAYDVTEDTLRIIFEPFGPVVKVDMPKEPGHVPVRSKGFAFVEFERPESARAALQTMDGMPLKGRPMKVNTPTGGPNAQTSLLSQLLMQQGGQGLAALQGQQLNSATLAAIQAAQIASGGTLLGGLPSSVASPVSAPPAFILPAHLTPGGPSFGVPSVYERAPGTIAGNTAKTRIYVGSLMWQLAEEQVRQIFEPFGAIRSCQLIINPETGKHRGYGFIEFADEKSAADAIKEMDGFDLVGRKLKVRYASALVAPQAAQQAHLQHQQLQQQFAATAQLPPGFTVPTLPASLTPGAASFPQQPASQPSQQSLSAEDNMRIRSSEQRYSLMQRLDGSSSASPVLLLRNLLAPSEVDAELEGEVRDECGKSGPVRSVRVMVADDEVRCYVLFESAADCTRAKQVLHGRFFGKRAVTADFYPLSSFESGILTVTGAP